MTNIQQKERNKEIVKLRNDGVSCQEIADKFSISKQRVTEIYNRETTRDLIKREKKTKWSSHYPNFIKEYKEGSVIQEIAKKYGCSTRTVFMALKKEGLTGRGRQMLFV